MEYGLEYAKQSTILGKNWRFFLQMARGPLRIRSFSWRFSSNCRLTSWSSRSNLQSKSRIVYRVLHIMNPLSCVPSSGKQLNVGVQRTRMYVPLFKHFRQLCRVCKWIEPSYLDVGGPDGRLHSNVITNDSWISKHRSFRPDLCESFSLDGCMVYDLMKVFVLLLYDSTTPPWPLYIWVPIGEAEDWRRSQTAS